METPIYKYSTTMSVFVGHCPLQGRLASGWSEVFTLPIETHPIWQHCRISVSPGDGSRLTTSVARLCEQNKQPPRSMKLIYESCRKITRRRACFLSRLCWGPRRSGAVSTDHEPREEPPKEPLGDWVAAMNGATVGRADSAASLLRGVGDRIVNIMNPKSSVRSKK